MLTGAKMAATMSHACVSAWSFPRSRARRRAGVATYASESAARMYLAVPVLQPREKTLLTPRGRAGVEERRAGLEKA